MLVAALASLVGCSGGGGIGHAPQTTDTLYTEERAMASYANDKQQALLLIDSARQVGNLTAERAALLRATVYGRTLDAPRYDSAIVISESLLDTKTAKTDSTFRQEVLELLVYATRQLEDYELQLVYSTQLADAYRRQGNHVEALRSDAEMGAVLYRLGKDDVALDKLDSVIYVLSPVRRFNELDASIIAMKRKIGVIRDYRQIATEGRHILSRLADYEQHPADYHDGSPREPADEARPGYIAFYRAQAWTYLAAAYAHIASQQTAGGDGPYTHAADSARKYLALAEQSDFGQTLGGRKMLAPTLCQLGEYGKMEAIYQELERVVMESGDTLTLDYAQLLLDRAKAAASQGRMSESNTLWQRHAQTLQKAEERLLRSKASLYAARYHAQEQQAAINHQQAELSQKNLLNIVLAIGLAVLLALLVYGAYLLRMFKQKNAVLAHEISEAITYRDKYLALTVAQQPVSGAEPAPAYMVNLDDVQLFQYISQVVVRDKLFLDPNLNRQKLTEALSLSKDRIGAAFSKGSPYKSVTDYINDLRLPYAAQLLTERTDLSIAEVAEQSGYARAATFTTNFKKKYALTPAQYREKLLGS